MLLTDAFIKKQLRELNAKKLAGESIERETRLSDGGGLYLLLKSSGSAYWRLRYRFQGEDRLTSFGEYKYISLALAREKREEYKSNIARGIDPRGIKDQENVLTFREVAIQLFFGLFANAVWPIYYAMTSDSAEEHATSTDKGIITTAMFIGGGISPLLMGSLIQLGRGWENSTGYIYTFFTMAGYALLGVLLQLMTVDKSPSQAH